jgi:hypothetical protein
LSPSLRIELWLEGHGVGFDWRIGAWLRRYVRTDSVAWTLCRRRRNRWPWIWTVPRAMSTAKRHMWGAPSSPLLHPLVFLIFLKRRTCIFFILSCYLSFIHGTCSIHK